MFQGASAAFLRCAPAGRPVRPGRVGSVGVGAGERALRALGGAGSSGLEGGAAASARAALCPEKEAPRRRAVIPGPAGPVGLPPRHSLALHGAQLSRPTCRPTATEGPSERANEGATSASLGWTTTSVREARPHVSEWPAPAAAVESADSHWEVCLPLSPVSHFYWLWRLSVTLLGANPPSSLALIGRGSACPTPCGRRGITGGVGATTVCGQDPSAEHPGKGSGNSVRVRPGVGGTGAAGLLHLRSRASRAKRLRPPSSCDRCFHL